MLSNVNLHSAYSTQPNTSNVYVYIQAPDSAVHCNLRKHMQIHKTQANEVNIFINFTTHVQDFEKAPYRNALC